MAYRLITFTCNREMNYLNQDQYRLYEKLNSQIDALDQSFDGVMDDLNGIKDMFHIMEAFLGATDENQIRRCFLFFIVFRNFSICFVCF